LPSETRPLTQWLPVQLHHAATVVAARVVLLGDEPITPGSDGLAQLVLEHPIAAAAGDRFVLRDTTAQRTMAGGRVLDLRAPPRRRRTPERLAQLAACAFEAPEQALAALLETAPFFVDLSGFCRDHALATAQLNAMAERLHLVRATVGPGEFVLSQA